MVNTSCYGHDTICDDLYWQFWISYLRHVDIVMVSREDWRVVIDIYYDNTDRQRNLEE